MPSMPTDCCPLPFSQPPSATCPLCAVIIVVPLPPHRRVPFPFPKHCPRPGRTPLPGALRLLPCPRLALARPPRSTAARQDSPAACRGANSDCLYSKCQHWPGGCYRVRPHEAAANAPRPRPRWPPAACPPRALRPLRHPGPHHTPTTRASRALPLESSCRPLRPASPCASLGTAAPSVPPNPTLRGRNPTGAASVSFVRACVKSPGTYAARPFTPPAPVGPIPRSPGVAVPRAPLPWPNPVCWHVPAVTFSNPVLCTQAEHASRTTHPAEHSLHGIPAHAWAWHAWARAAMPH